MKLNLMTAAALVALTGAASADPTSDYRMWSAEQMINRLTIKFAQSNSACKQPDLLDLRPKLSEACVQAVASAYPILATIRIIAASGDPVAWAEIIDKVHTFEAEIEAPLNALQRR